MKIRKLRGYCLILIIIGILIILFYNNKEQKNSEKTIVQSEIVINGQIISNLEQNINIELHVDETTGVKYVTYDDFGAKAEEGYDDYNVIKETHAFANENNYEVKAEEGKNYHIYRLDETEPITIQTNTDWNNANIIIHDEGINDKNTRNYAIFQIKSNISDTIIRDNETLKNIEVNKQTKKIKELAGYGECLCIVYNSDKKQYIRSGGNQNSGASQEDIFKIDNEGNVLNEIQWDFEKVTWIRLIKIPDETITIENGNFITILPENDYEQASGYFNRNIICNRSNTIIKNIKHNVDNTQRLAGPYFGFLRISFATDIIIENSSLYSHKYSQKSNYDLILEHSANITIDKVISNDIEDIYRWGITGTNYTKDIIYKDCVLNRIDSHTGVHNLSIENCTIGVKGITLTGSGIFNLKNVTRLGSESFIELRADYGSSWNGTINITDCTYKPTYSNQIISFFVTYDNNELHDYGYDLYLPNININNLKIEDENNLNNSNQYYIFYNTKDKTGTENGDMRNNFKLPQNIIVKKYQIKSGKKLKLFSNKFYSSLNETGINLSMPLSDKTEVEVINAQGEKIENQTITNKDIQINKTETEGIATTVKVNNEVKNEEQINLNQDGNYKIEAIYQNSNGESESNTVNVTIDKTSPSITGATEGKSYKYNVTPRVYDANLKEIKLNLNGEEVKSYKEGNELTEEGYYQLTATDKAGNTKTISFYLVEPGDEDYKIRNEKIENITHYTKKSEFSQKFEFSKEYDILRKNKILSDSDYIATGDILRTKSGEEYTLIVAGDINKDGKVDIKDIIKLRKYLVSPNKTENKLDEEQLLAADTNLDQKTIGIRDLVRMRIIALTAKE